MDKKSSLFSASFGFVVGALSMFYWNSRWAERSLKDVIPNRENRGVVTAEIGFNAEKNEKNKLSIESTQSESKSNLAPSLKVQDYLASKSQTDSDLLRIASEKYQKGMVQSSSNQNNGEELAHEKLPDGSDVDRSYGGNGILTSERRQYEGNILDRSFYETGQTKVFRWILADGSTIGAGLTAEGNYTFRVDEFPNGEKLSYEYDDRGNLTKKWLVKKDGAAIRLQ